MYEIKIAAAGLRHLNRLPDKVRQAALETIFGPIAENPHRAGKPLSDELEGLRSARRGDYRIVGAARLMGNWHSVWQRSGKLYGRGWANCMVGFWVEVC